MNTKIKEINKEVIDAIKESFEKISTDDYTSYILYIGRADVICGLKKGVGSDYVIDYQLDHYYDETREAFYVRYMKRNYSEEGFSYESESGIDDLSIEMMIYCHLWDSTYFLKSLCRLAAILDGKGYLWNPDMPENGKYNYIKEKVINPLQAKSIHLGNIVEKAFDSNIRNAFAHSLYNVNVKAKKIYTRTKQGRQIYTFEEFQKKFLYSVTLMNKLKYYLELNHDEACKKNRALTVPFPTPDGMIVQVYGKMITRAGNQFPEFRLVKVK